MWRCEKSCETNGLGNRMSEDTARRQHLPRLVQQFSISQSQLYIPIALRLVEFQAPPSLLLSTLVNEVRPSKQLIPSCWHSFVPIQLDPSLVRLHFYFLQPPRRPFIGRRIGPPNIAKPCRRRLCRASHFGSDRPIERSHVDAEFAGVSFRLRPCGT